MSLGELSTILVWGATTAYAVALVAFATDLARLADHAAASARQRGAELASTAGGSTAVLERTDAAVAPERRRAVGIAMSTATLGLLLHVVGTVLRGLAAGRVPWANMYEFTLVGTLVAVATFLALCRWRDLRFLGTIVLGLSVLALGLALAAFYVPADAVEPALQSYWLVIHVSIATIATGLFTVSFALSSLQLLKDSWEQASPRLHHPRWQVLGSLPSTRDLEAISFRINAVGFVLWTFTVMAGAIWAEHAWGRYWGWDPKEVWSFVVWVVYAAYLHARTTRGWSGRRAAWFVLVGYATVLFNFTGVNLLLNGKHSYDGIPEG
ncbi:c-type cytochrome biogenesis protein CcsB [Actinotalea subterranea]|uniref:c-type cytochrome biogenesis protein CcsB n=1 Tax=Actinotalea subterranea TaxID=2607497 RepID=UPI0011EEB125|nr:c-type cytochrome biogenesis protein CcsB [Actinotalea subterranea]